MGAHRGGRSLCAFGHIILSGICLSLVIHAQYVLVVAAGESTLVGFNPASWVLLLHQVPARLRQAVLVEWNPIDCPLHPSIADTGGHVHSRQLDLAPSPLLWPVVCIAWSSATGSDDGNLRVGCIEGEVVRSFALELSAHHHRPLSPM